MPVTSYVPLQNQTGSVNQWRIQWPATPNGNTGSPLTIAGSFADRTVQVGGTFGSSGTAVIEGSNASSTGPYVTLTDPLGNALSFTAAGLKQITELPQFIRPNITNGDGTTAIDVTLYMHRIKD